MRESGLWEKVGEDRYEEPLARRRLLKSRREWLVIAHTLWAPKENT